MLIEKIQQKLIGFWPPLQMGGGADMKLRIAATGSSRFEKVEESSQMGIPPAADQQQRLLQPAGFNAVSLPLLRLKGIVLKPAMGHAFGVMAPEELKPVQQVIAVDQ